MNDCSENETTIRILSTLWSESVNSLPSLLRIDVRYGAETVICPPTPNVFNNPVPVPLKLINHTLGPNKRDLSQPH